MPGAAGWWQGQGGERRGRACVERRCRAASPCSSEMQNIATHALHRTPNPSILTPCLERARRRVCSLHCWVAVYHSTALPPSPAGLG